MVQSYLLLTSCVAVLPLFTAAPTDPVVQASFLGKLSPTIDQEQAALCEGPLTPEECLTVLYGMARCKAPGLDGLAMEFYVKFWNVLGGDLVSVLNSCFHSGCLSLSGQRCHLPLI